MGRTAEGYIRGSKGAPVEPGNIDLNLRPRVQNPDGSFSTLRSMSFNENGLEVLIPTISQQGTQWTDREAIEVYRATGRHLGKFRSPGEATSFAKGLSKRMEGKESGKDPSSGLAAAHKSLIGHLESLIGGGGGLLDGYSMSRDPALAFRQRKMWEAFKPYTTLPEAAFRTPGFGMVGSPMDRAVEGLMVQPQGMMEESPERRLWEERMNALVEAQKNPMRRSPWLDKPIRSDLPPGEAIEDYERRNGR